ncbi:MAG: transposase [Planctomycetaceae bacterium]|nr:transposase [Planctomycetaceae bacterium]
MPQSLANVLLHIVFSTKHREPWIDEGDEPELHAYLATACKSLDCPPHKIGSADDHVHLAVSLGRSTTIAALVQHIKQDSSRWIKTKGPTYADFAWQAGYGAFSIGQSQLDDLRRYIAGQREHHRRESFQDEYRKILARYGVEFDERFVWD